MEIVWQGLTYVSTPEREVSSCNGCVFHGAGGCKALDIHDTYNCTKGSLIWERKKGSDNPTLICRDDAVELMMYASGKSLSICSDNIATYQRDNQITNFTIREIGLLINKLSK